jgi:hypothetical protein
VTVLGAGFVTDGGPAITFAGFPASSASCSSDTRCVAVTPYPGPSAGSQVVHVQATIHGVLGEPGSLSSEPRPEDVYTYLGGPDCTGALTCEGPYFPKVVVTCTTTVNFYIDPVSGSQSFVGTGTTYAAQTENLGGLVAACTGTPTNGSCTTFSIYEPIETYCGAPGFCAICTKFGGTCSSGMYRCLPPADRGSRRADPCRTISTPSSGRASGWRASARGSGRPSTPCSRGRDGCSWWRLRGAASR